MSWILESSDCHRTDAGRISALHRAAHSPTSANCSSRLRWMMEKLSSDTSVRIVSPLRVAMHGDAFHVVDLVGEIGLDQRLAIDQRVRLDAGQRHAADAHGDAAQPANSGARAASRSPGGRIVQSLTSKSSLRLTLKRVDAIAVEKKRAHGCRAASRLRSVTAISSPASGEPCRRRRQAFQTLVVGEGLEIGRHLDRLAARLRPSRR